jgi:Ca2+-dependent lipid-binding protein
VEGARRSTAVVRKELNPAWGTKMRFNITDISADLVMQVFSVGGSFDTPKLIGQAIVPLHRLLPKIGTDFSKVLYTVTLVNVPRP